MVEVPSLCGRPFDYFSVTLSFENGDVAEAKGGDFAADSRWYEGVSIDATRGESETESTVAHLRNEVEIGEGDLTVELSLELRTGFQIRSGETKGVEVVSQALQELTGVPCRATVEASFQVSRAELPARGLISSMLGVKTTVAGEQLLLTGANFTMRGFPEESVTWFISQGGALRGTVTRTALVEFSESFLADSLYRAQTWFHRLILEKAEPAYAIGE